MFLHSVEMIFDLYPDLPLSRLVPHKGMFEQLVSVRSLVVIFHKKGFDKVLKLAAPPFRF